MRRYMEINLHGYMDPSRVQRLYVRRDSQPTLVGAAYFAWHRMYYGNITVCRGVNDDRDCSKVWRRIKAIETVK